MTCGDTVRLPWVWLPTRNAIHQARVSVAAASSLTWAERVRYQRVMSEVDIISEARKFTGHRWMIQRRRTKSASALSSYVQAKKIASMMGACDCPNLD